MKHKHGPKRLPGTYAETTEAPGHGPEPQSLQEARSVFLDRQDDDPDIAEPYEALSDDQLYRRARELDIPKRSSLVREDLIDAIRQAEDR
jgi:hypothetical protein